MTYQGDQIVKQVSLSDRHSCQTFVVDVDDMDVEVICCQLALMNTGGGQLTVRWLVVDKQSDLILLHPEFVFDNLSSCISNLVQ
jgi:hypothetical protein